jgi:uncharacterized protein (DUF1800 family)
MTLVWHDWFATSNEGVGSQRLMIEQNKLFRRAGLGSFPNLVQQVTQNPAMLLYLNGLNSLKGSPNENYARELMELFTLGHGAGYTERDVREQARALTGFTATWKDGPGWVKFRWDRNRHDDAMKVVFGKVGPFGWGKALELCLEHEAHAPYFVNKLWSYFIPEAPDRETAAGLQELYVKEGKNVRPVLRAILRHPRLYEGPRMVKSPVVFLAGMLRTLGDRIATEDYVWLSVRAGQLLFYPPDVAGWNHDRWLDTSTFQARWDLASRVLRKHAMHPEHTKRGQLPEDPERLVQRALAFWGNLQVTPATKQALLAYSQKAMGAAIAVRHLVAVSPEMQSA